jgi:integrase
MEQVKLLVSEIKKEMDPKYITKFIVLFGIATGARYAEIIGLTWDCEDFENKTITINKTWDYKDLKDFDSTKNYASNRTITIDKDTCDMLRLLKHNQNRLALQTGLRNTKDLVFINNKMQLVTVDGVNKTLRIICKKIGANTITSHGLRHTHASMLLYI